MSQKKSRAVTYILAAVGLVVGGYFVVKIWQETDVASALRLIALLPVPTIIMLALPSVAGAALDSKAWQLLLPRNGKRDSMWSMARVRVSSEAVVSTVPMGAIVADPLKAWLLKREFGLSLACGSASVALRTFLLADSQSILTLIVTIISFGWLMEVSPAILTGNGYLAWILLIASVVACVMYTALIYLGSHQASLERLHSGLRKIRGGFVSMDLCDAFAAAARTVLPQAAIVHDKYHLERLNQRAIDLTRRQELPEIPELKGERFWLLRSSATRPPEHQAFFDAIHQSSSTTARTWQAAEDFRAVYKFETSFDARSYLLNWVNKYCITPIRPLRRLVETFERARQGIVNFFDHPITNALAERMNGKIQEIKLLAKGFRTFEHFKIAVLFYWGGLELYPLKSQ